MAPPEKKPRTDQDCDWDDFEDVPFEVVEQAEVYASQVLSRIRQGEPPYHTTSGNHANVGAQFCETAPVDSRSSAAPVGELSLKADRTVRESIPRAAASAQPHNVDIGVGKPASFQRTSSFSGTPGASSTPIHIIAAASTSINKSQVFVEDLNRSTQQEVEMLSQRLLTKDGEIKMLRTSLKQRNADLTKLKQDKLLELKSLSSTETEKEQKLQRQLESLRTQLHFQERELAELRSSLSTSKRQNAQAARGCGDYAGSSRGTVRAAVSPPKKAAGFPSSKSFYGATGSRAYDQDRTSAAVEENNLWRAETDAADAPEPLTLPLRCDKSKVELVRNLMACGLCELLVADTDFASALETTGKSNAHGSPLRIGIKDFAQQAMQRLLADLSSAEPRQAFGSREPLALLPAIDTYLCAYTDQLRQPAAKGCGPPSGSRLCSQTGVLHGASAKAQKCLLGLCHLCAFSADVCLALLGGWQAMQLAAASCLSRVEQGAAYDQLLTKVLECADARLCEEDPRRLGVTTCALQLLLVLCHGGASGVADRSHIAKEACSRFSSLISNGLLPATLSNEDPAVIQGSLALLAAIVTHDSDGQSSLICCPTRGWCIFDCLSSALKKTYRDRTADIHLQVLHLLGSLCMLSCCRGHLAAETSACISNKLVVPSVISLMYHHVLAYEETHTCHGRPSCTQPGWADVPHSAAHHLDLTIVQQGVYVLHMLTQIDGRFSCRQGTVEHEYAYVMNFASQFYRESRQSQCSAFDRYTDEESLLDCLWDFEDEYDSDDKDVSLQAPDG